MPPLLQWDGRGVDVIILENADDGEYLRWRYWEAVNAARHAVSIENRTRHIRVAESYRLQSRQAGLDLPALDLVDLPELPAVRKV
ncbi:hypothetical protein [Rhizorhabdus sp.]|jgi:hypothetical protein|uniref:hypothetical protein n=1 Tax=Rhizorhabdus sp. TaxID=1968843 RepID=UPI001B65FAD5|nr:hypothetical protein [Rhizorhabdus sp.]MBP8235427.1 hypothetical protein [Rhizorhabdus sp.]